MGRSKNLVGHSKVIVSSPGIRYPTKEGQTQFFGPRLKVNYPLKGYNVNIRANKEPLASELFNGIVWTIELRNGSTISKFAEDVSVMLSIKFVERWLSLIWKPEPEQSIPTNYSTAASILEEDNYRHELRGGLVMITPMHYYPLVMTQSTFQRENLENCIFYLPHRNLTLHS